MNNEAPERSIRVAIDSDGLQARDTDAVPQIPLVWLYVLSVASGGLYLFYWIYRVAKGTGAGRQHRFTPLWWSAGAVAAPICCVVLYDFAVQARRVSRQSGLAPHIPLMGPALLHAAISLVLFFGPLSQLWLPGIFVLPLPFLWLQSEMNRVRGEQRELSMLGLPPAAVRWGMVVAVLPLVLYASGSSDLSLLSTPGGITGAGVRVDINDSPVHIVLPSDGWRSVETGSVSQDPSELELVGPGANTWLVAYVNRDPSSSLNGIVSNRRDLIFEDFTAWSIKERRFFLKETDLVPASMSRYGVGSRFAENAVYLVMTIETDDSVVELLGYTSSPAQYENELRKLLESVAFDSPEDS